MEAVGVVAVIASLVLVAYEIRQNTKAISAQAVAGLNEEASEGLRMMIESREFTEAFVRAETEPHTLSRADQVQLYAYCWDIWNRLETAHTYYVRGIIDTLDYGSWRDSACEVQRLPQCVSFLPSNRRLFNTAFMADVESWCAKESS